MKQHDAYYLFTLKASGHIQKRVYKQRLKKTMYNVNLVVCHYVYQSVDTYRLWKRVISFIEISSCCSFITCSWDCVADCRQKLVDISFTILSPIPIQKCYL